MIHKLVIPIELGESIEVRLLDWLKAEGDAVAVGDALFEFETDKAIVLVTASQAGVLRKLLGAAGDWMKPGDTVAWLGDDGQEPLPAPGSVPADDMQVTYEAT